ncbi:MAG TPA: hypothetical protein VFN85_09420 [Solirubrobacterales bacterium]|nr:hypothetical protein [Solirubrobacterales bacterium]
MILRHLTVVLLALSAAAITVAGCGSTSSSAPETLPKAAFLHKADGICERAGNEQTVKAAAYLEDHQNAKEADLVVPAGIPPLEKELKELRDLGLPQGHEDEAEAFLAEVEKGLQALKEEPSSALSPKTNPYKKANELGEKLGLVDCARNP